MTPGLREYKQATLRVAIAEGLPEDMRAHVRELLSVQSSNPRKGHATALMWQTCAEADKHWVTLMVQVRPFDDGPDREKLQRWYGRFGFVKFQDEPLLMARTPNPPVIARMH